MGKYYEFDKSEIYREQIKPLVDQINEICVSEEIPFFMIVNTKNVNMDGKMEAIYERAALSATSFSKEIQDDEITHHVAVAQGAKICFGEDVTTGNEANMSEEDEIIFQ